MAVTPHQVGDADELQVVIHDAEKALVLEVDSKDVSADGKIALAAAESEAAVVAPEGQEVALGAELIEARQSPDGNR